MKKCRKEADPNRSSVSIAIPIFVNDLWRNGREGNLRSEGDQVLGWVMKSKREGS
jgi:hypothetical protein